MDDDGNKLKNENDRVINFVLNAKESKGWSTMPMYPLSESSDDQEETRHSEKMIASMNSYSKLDSKGDLSFSDENVRQLESRQSKLSKCTEIIRKLSPASSNNIVVTNNPSEMEMEQMHLGTKEKDFISTNIWMPMLYSLFALLIATKYLHLYQSQNLFGILDSQSLSQYSMAVSIAFGVGGIALAYMCNQKSPIESCSNSTCGQSTSMSRLTPIAMIVSSFLGFYSLGYLMMSCSLTSIDREGSEYSYDFSYGMKPFAWLFMAISFYLCLYQ